jgi:prepilin-type N-terminal cleavage/methylation domain-containing protein
LQPAPRQGGNIGVRPRRGLTLLEILVAATIILILGAIVLVALAQVRRVVKSLAQTLSIGERWCPGERGLLRGEGLVNEC